MSNLTYEPNLEDTSKDSKNFTYHNGVRSERYRHSLIEHQVYVADLLDTVSEMLAKDYREKIQIYNALETTYSMVHILDDDQVIVVRVDPLRLTGNKLDDSGVVDIWRPTKS